MNIESKQEYRDVVFNKENLSNLDIKKSYFYSCEFVNCNISGSNLSDSRFVGCIFKYSDLSNAILLNTVFREVEFISCKLIGLDFSDCIKMLLEMTFKSCDLSYCLFTDMNLRRMRFDECRFFQAEFNSCNLSDSSFDESMLAECKFADCNLTNSDFRFAHKYFLDPRNNILKKAKFRLPDVLSLLSPYDIIIDNS
ncbi:MAG: pentapeptide repeat-containing protein [Phycisphaerae bacterium]|nr:pentapeptide repeat-containing protein [Phycisphaerae bacterium]